MKDVNTITISGNLAEDPVLRYTGNTIAVSNMRIGVNNSVFNKETGEYEDRLDGFFNVTTWRTQAENVAQSLKKGTRVLITGRLKSRSYLAVPGDESTKKWVTEIEAEEVTPSLRFASAVVTKNPKANQAPPADPPAEA